MKVSLIISLTWTSLPPIDELREESNEGYLIWHQSQTLFVTYVLELTERLFLLKYKSYHICYFSSGSRMLRWSEPSFSGSCCRYMPACIPGHTHVPSMFLATIHRVSLFILSFTVHTRSPITKIFKIKIFILTMLDVMPFMCIVYREWKCDISNPNG